jgi:flavin-binding protein dodecin
MVSGSDHSLVGSSFDSFEDAVLQAIASGAAKTGDSPHRFNVVQLSIEVGGFVGRPQFFADVAPVADPNM